MPRKNPHKGASSLTTRILVSIRDEIRELRSDTNKHLDELRSDTNKQFGELRSDTNKQLESVRGEIRQLRSEANERIDHLRNETKAGLREVHDSLSIRLDKLIENTGHHYRELEARVFRIERDVDSLKSP